MLPSCPAIYALPRRGPSNSSKIIRSDPVTFLQTGRPRKSFTFNTCELSRKCGKQRTYRKPKSFRCNTYKKEGGGVLWLNQLPPVKIAVLSFHPLMNCPLFPREKQSLSFHALTNCPFSIPFVLTFMHRMGGVGGSQAVFLKYYFNFPAARTAPAFGRPDAPTFQRFNVQTCLRRFAAFPFPAIHSGDGNLAAA